METIIQIAVGLLILSVVVLIVALSSVKAKYLTKENDLIHEQEVLWRQTEKVSTELDDAQKEIAHLNTVIEYQLNRFNEAHEQVLHAAKDVKKVNKALRKRIEDIGTDFSHRNVIGSQYKVGELLYHISPKTGKIEKHKVDFIDITDFGTEFDVYYHFSYGKIDYSILEDNCFKDEGVAKMMLVEQP